MSEKIKNTDETEFRTEQSEKVVEFLDRSGAYEYFRDLLEGGKEVPDFDRFKDFVTRINGIARDIPISQRKFDGVNVGLSGFIENVIVPKHEDKEGLLQYAYESIKDIDKEDIKYMLPAVINAVHLFNDGNGRTSRVLHLLLSKFGSKEDFLSEAKKALGKDGRFDSLDINPGLIGLELEREVLKDNGWILNAEGYPKQLGIIECGFRDDVRDLDEKDEKNKLAKRFFDLEDALYELTAVYKLLGGDNGIKPLLQKYGEKKITAISRKKMIDLLDVEQWKELENYVFDLKKQQVLKLVDIFRATEKYKTQRGKIKTVRDAFIEDIQKRGNYI